MKINSRTLHVLLIVFVAILIIISLGLTTSNQIARLLFSNNTESPVIYHVDFGNISRTSSYNDSEVIMQEQQEHVNRSNTSVYYFKTNYWHPAKVRIISNTWSLCTDEQGANLDMFVFLWTRPSTFKLRQVIRETWGSRVTYPNMNVAFILGLSSDSAQNEKILEENQLHGDVIQGDFRDSYRNLSFKSLISWRWVKYNCMNVKYFLKIDDDVYPHTRKLLGHIKNVFSKKPPPPFSFSCSIWFASGAIRDKHSKYYVSEQEWPDPIFPYYCSGVAYLFTNDLPAALYNFSFTTKDFWIADVNDGMLARNIKNVTFIDWSRSYYRKGFNIDPTTDLNQLFFFEPFDTGNTGSYAAMTRILREKYFKK